MTTYNSKTFFFIIFFLRLLRHKIFENLQNMKFQPDFAQNPDS
jgi:hypothetical protein